MDTWEHKGAVVLLSGWHKSVIFKSWSALEGRGSQREGSRGWGLQREWLRQTGLSEGGYRGAG